MERKSLKVHIYAYPSSGQSNAKSPYVRWEFSQFEQP